MIKFLKKPINLEHWSLMVFFLGFFILGISVFRDYGMSWDEKAQRGTNGKVVFDFIYHGEYQKYLNSAEKYHGPAVELPLYTLERVFGINDSRNIFLFRHFINFFLFYLSVIVFYYLIRKVYSDWRIAIIGAVMYILCPRIFADAFYNSKDLPFLSFFTLGIYTAVRLYEEQNFKNILLHSIVCGFLIAIRITGMMLPAITLMICFIKLFFIDKNFTIKRIVGLPLFLIAITFFFTILFWPILWFNPFNYFGQAWTEMSHYGWGNGMLYRNEFISSNDIPWHYVPTWVLITTPIATLVLLISGIILFFVTFFQLFISKKNHQEKKLLLNIFSFISFLFTPVLAVIFLNSSIYDGWRHLYFINGPLIAISCFPIYIIFRNTRVNKALTTTALLICYLPVIIFMICNHPYQNLYFNKLYFRNLNEARFKFEMDYWGLTFCNGLNYICQSDSRAKIKIKMSNDAGENSILLLPKKYRDKIIVVEKRKEADYMITNYRWTQEEYSEPDSEVYHLIIDSAKVMAVFKIKKQ